MSLRHPKLTIFLLLSLIVHVLFVALYGLGAQWSRRAAQHRQADEARARETEANPVGATREAAREAARTQTRETLIDELAQHFTELVTNSMPAAKQEAAWQAITNALDPSLRALARDLADPEFPERDLQDALLALKRDMVTNLRDQLAEERRAETMTQFDEVLRTELAPAVAEFYRQAVERLVGRHLVREASGLVRDEERLHQRVAGELRKQADLALAESKQAQATLDQAVAAVEQGRVPQKEVTVTKGSLDRAALRLGYLADNAAAWDPALASRVETVRSNALAQAVRAHEGVATIPAMTLDAGTTNAIRTAATAAAALTDAVTRLREEVNAAVDYSGPVAAREAVQHVLATGGQAQLERAFAERFSAESLPRLGIQLADALDATAGAPATAAHARAAWEAQLAESLRKALGDVLAPSAPALEATRRSLGLPTDVNTPTTPPEHPRMATLATAMQTLLTRYADGPMTEAAGPAAGENGLARALKAWQRDRAPAADPLYGYMSDVASSLASGRTGFFEAGGHPLSFQTLRQEAYDRTRYAEAAARSGYRFEQDAYDKLTAGIQSRTGMEGLPRTMATPPDASPSPPETTDLPTRAARLLLPGGDTPPSQTVSDDTPYAPTFPHVRFLQIPFRKNPITLDGELNDWSGVPEVELPVSWAAGATPDAHTPATQRVRLAWDHSGIYLAATVIDPDRQISVVPHTRFWDGDAVEIHLDGRNRKQRHRTSDWGQQFWVWPRTTAAADGTAATCGEASWSPGDGWYWAPKGRDYLGQAARATADGWTLEVHAPRERLRDLPLEPGRLIGLNLSVCVGTPAYYYLAGGTEVHPSDHPDTWADALLAGADGTLSTDTPAGLPPGAFGPGDRVRLRVVDADMNLSDTGSDRVAVMAEADGGERATIVLQETTPASGEFEGWLHTALRTGVPRPAVLTVYEGERVRLRYVDQARASAARAVDITLDLHAAAPIASF